MKKIQWDPAKSRWLKEHRGASFEEIIQADLIAIQEHPRRAHQKVMLFDWQGYIWVVVYVEVDQEIFLKTAYPSRKYTRRIRRGDYPL